MKHEQYLNKCIELARRGASGTHPNPMVGAVIVNNAGEIIGEGFHQAYGEAHAEVNAVRDALSRGQSLQGTTIYVSLEPCAHHGKTPPCVDLILKHEFARLVFASKDPNPLVSGKGLGKLARTEIISPELLDISIVREAEYLNRAFFKTIKRESWVTAKIAITEDGRMITRDDEPRWITNTNARKNVHLMRASHQAVITGMGTVRADDPQLNVRYSAEELGIAKVVQPRRIVLSKNTIDRTVVDCFGASQLAMTNDPDGSFMRSQHECSNQIFSGDKPARIMNGSDLKSLISELRQEGLTKLMLEAGPTLTQAFLEQRLVNELIIYQPLKGEPEIAAKMIAQDYGDCFGATHLAMTHQTTKYEIIPGTNTEPDNIKVSLLF